MSTPDMTIEQLELSVRTSSLLEELGVLTLAQVLALPEIVATPLSIAELREVFDELGVSYAGKFVSSAKIVNIAASGSVEERWQTIKSWLLNNHPSAYEEFSIPATEVSIAAAEEKLALRLPEDYRRFLLLHNGQTSCAAMVMTCSLFPVESLQEERMNYSHTFDEENQPVDAADVDPAIRPVEHTEGWIPIGRSARGRDFLCLDMDPSDKGTIGQVILTAVDFDQHKLLAPSFKEFLSHYFMELQTGEIELDDGDL